MAVVYLVSVQESHNSYSLIANGQEELIKKLTKLYNLSEKQIEELVETEHLIFRTVDIDGIINTNQLRLDFTVV